MNPFLLPPQERLAHWKTFRNTLPTLTETDQLLAVARYWGQAPLMKFSFDMEQPSEWPTPWEMIYEGNWCKSALAIAMEFTLRLSGWNPDRLQLVMMRDYDIEDIFMVLKIDGTTLLNYNHGTISPMPSTRYVEMFAYQFNGRHYNEIVD